MADQRSRADLLAEIADLRAQLEEQGRAADAAPMLAFAQSIERFRRLLRSLGAFMLEVDPAGQIVRCSLSAEELIGTPAASLRGRPFAELVHPDDKARLEALLDRADTDQPERLRLRHARGAWRHFELQVASGERLDGDRQRLVFARDVTEMHDALVALRTSEDRYRALAENALDLIVELDANGRFLYASPNSAELLGVPPDELIGRDITSIIQTEHIHDEDRSLLLDGFRRRVRDRGEGGQRIYRIRHRDGRERWFESRARTYLTAAGELRALVISRDVTDRIEAQRELAEIEKRYTLLGETSRDLITETDPDRRFVYLSPSVRGLLGYEPDELLGRDGAELIHPEDRARVRRDFYASVEDPRVAFTPPFRCRLKDGRYRWFEGTGRPYTRPDGSGPFVIGLLRDVHDRILQRQEWDALEERVQRSQRLEGLGVMAGGIAHDFNNLLTPILGQSSLALLDLPDESPARERIEKVRTAARRAAKLTNQMLAYAGAGPLLFESTDLTALVREMGQLVESTASGKAVIRFDLAQDLAPVEADGAQLSQVVMNLISNAAEAVGDGTGTIHVRTRSISGSAIEQSDLVVGEVDPDQRYVCFEVEDTGVGMDPATRAHIFDPFFTTKFTGRGLGLAAVLGIVRGHDGAIELDTHPGRGTRFRVLLPPRASGAQDREEGASTAGWRCSGLILVADDDNGVRDVACDTLRRCGFDVLTASDGREALERFAEHRDEIRAVLLDRTMPVVSGEDAFASLRKQRPYLPVIILSGYSEESISPAIAAHQPDGFLKKPFLPEVLVDTIRKVLDG
jgi:PAS domain S-box-containing protein